MKKLSPNEVAVIIETMERAVANGQLDSSWLNSVQSKLQPKKGA